MPQSDRTRQKERGGKRIEAARALFGNTREEGHRIGETSFALTHVPSVHLISVENHLLTSELQGSVVSTLLETFLENCSRTHVTFISETTFRETFERAGRRLAALDDQSQVLYHVAIAVAARSTDSPLLVGPNAPKSIELGHATQIGMDLRPYGMAREGACRALTEKAMQMADEKATLRFPSVEALASLLLIEGLIEQNDVSDAASRPYAQAASSHTRHLMEDETPVGLRERVAGSVLGYTAYIRDAFTAAKTGRTPNFSEDDVLLLREGKPKPPSLRYAMQHRLPDIEASFWQLFSSYVEASATNATNAAKKLTGVSARRSPRLNVAFGHEYLDQIDLLRKAYPELRERLLLRLESIRGVPDNPVPKHVDFNAMLRGLRLSGTAQPFLLLRVIGQRVAAKRDIQSATITEIGEWPLIDGPGAEDEDYWNEVMSLQRRAVMMSFESAREIALILKETIDTGAVLRSGNFHDGRGTQLLFTPLTWVSNLLKMPAVEEGGKVADWTYASKIETLTWVLKAVLSIGWAYEKLARPAPWLKGEIEKLQLAQAVFESGSSASNYATASEPIVMTNNLFPIPAQESPATLSMEDMSSFLNFDFQNSPSPGGSAPEVFEAAGGQTSMDFDFEAILRTIHGGA